jgi:hypothetical protein
MTEEKRRHPRTEIKWPAVLITEGGHVFGQTLDLSIGGALIRSWEKPDFLSSFALIIRPPIRRLSMRVTAERVWATTFRLDSKTKVHAVGVRFIEVVDDDLEFLNRVISQRL